MTRETTQGVRAVGSQASMPPLKGSGAMYLMKCPQMPPFLTVQGGGSLLAHVPPVQPVT